ncbi:hypothetical protein OEW28_18595 [Defluviimonas sp. WL0002]|uniref:Uncharacterized protein n=1 Tax=Albidovulum marisflavi TaxID=2984159 RepID=A0ABT2ZHN7_9RHOB|nr:hypothetical protein [Defluviimonas sp. WL0002]MCV2870626.1 hypothetical protein [Defluviimonas sp. WL0002]
MAAGNWRMFGNALEQILKGGIDCDTDTFRMVLVTSGYTPDQSLHDTWSDISANEVAAGGGYSTHGKLLTVTVTRSGLVVTIDCDDQSWTSSTITAKYAVIVRDADANGALAAGDLVVAFVDLDTGGGSVSTTSGTLSITINASGVYQITASGS